MSDKYQINSKKGHIYTGMDTNKETILNNIDINYGDDANENINITKEIIDNRLILKYNNEVLKTFDIVSISSSKYDLTKDYIYIGTKELNIDNITVTNGTKEIINNKLVIKYNNEVLKTFDLVNMSSNKYDLTKDYIYTGTEEFSLDDITVANGIKEIINNKLVIKYNNEVLKTFDLVRISSTKYDLTKAYIYTGIEDFNLDNVIVTNGTKEITDNQLLIKYNDEVLKTFDLLSINFGSLEVGNKKILLTEEKPYTDFVSNITANGVTYKMFNGEKEITNENIKVGMTLKVYYNEEVLEEYSITDEYLIFDPNLNVDEENHLLKKIKEGTKVSDLIHLISTSGTITKLDKNNKELSDDDIIKTGDKIKIELSKETLTYKVSVLGDITGDGIINIADVGKLYKHVRKTSVMTELCELASSDIVEDNNIIISDVGKLYKYVRKVIHEL